MSDSSPSRLDDYLDVFVSPTKLFERRSDGKYGQALLVLAVLIAALFFATRTAMQPIFEADMMRGMAANPNMTPEQIEAAKKVGGVFTGIVLIIGMSLAPLVVGAFVWIASKIVGAAVTYAQGATIATFAFFPRLIEMVVGAIQALLMDESKLTGRHTVSLGVGRFLDPDSMSPVLNGYLGRIDLFTIWVTVLVGIGLKVMGKASTGQAAAGAAIVWVLGGLILFAQGLGG
ncbi:MAG: YIP1 family protein [Gemmatimonadales bacterium]|nr:YIP1 family protein [Gemmatimonadales bacterium]